MFVRLEKLNAERDSLDMEWGRLQLEQSYWSSHAFVERVANAKLQMNIAADPRCEDRPAVKLRSGENDAASEILSLALGGGIRPGGAGRASGSPRVRSNCSWSIIGFLAKQGDDRSMRVVKIAAHRGAITDRNGEPLAVSTPVDSIWVNPQELNENIDQLPKLARALKEDQQTLARRITSNLDREFLYLVRHMPPEQAAHIKALGHSRRLPAARIPPLLSGGRSVRPRGRIHHRR